MALAIIISSLVFGLFLLFKGGDILVDSAVFIAENLGMSKVIIALTIVAIGTSAPEILITISSVIGGHPDIAMGNVIGSNIANIALILGICGLFRVIPIDLGQLRNDILFLVFVSVVFAFFVYTREIDMIESLIFINMLIFYVIYNILQARKQRQTQKHIHKQAEAKQAEANQDELNQAEARQGNPTYSDNDQEKIAMIATNMGNKNQRKLNIIAFCKVVFAIILLIIGAEFCVRSAVALASEFGIAESLIASTIIAIGGSMPELATSIMASLKKQSEIIIGNIIGSNLFNILAAIGIGGLFANIPISDNFLNGTMLILLAATLLMAILLFAFKKITKLMAILFFFIYSFYVVFEYLTSVA